MALRILQFGAVLAVGYCLRDLEAPAFDRTEVTAFSRGDYTPGKNLSLSLTLHDPKNVIAQKGQSTTLTCHAESTDGLLEYVWFHNGNQIPQNDTRRVVFQNGTLYIPKVATGKKSNGVTGEYSCLVKNKAGALLSNGARLRVAFIESEFSRHPANQTVPVGQSTVLSCSIHSNPIDVQWEFNNHTLPHNSRYVPLLNGFLFIYDVQSSDSGFYRCKVTNDILNKTKYSRSAYLTVTTESMENQPPSILPLDSLSNTTLSVGEKLNLYCLVIGRPTPTVQWLNNDGIVVSATNRLIIDNVNFQHSGRYTCSAYNSLGHANKMYRVEVVQKPSFKIWPESKSYPAGSTARIKCQAEGTPEPRIYWLKNGVPIAFNATRKNGELLYAKASTNDTGIYQCVAVNSVGKTWRAAEILINVSHGPPENLKCRPYDSTSICLSWLPPSNVSVLGYSVQLFYKSSDGHAMPGPDPVTRDTYQHVENLDENTNYTFSVRVYSNLVGSDPAEVTCKPGLKGNRNLTIELIKPDTLLLTWSEISLDRRCDGEKKDYEVHWREEGQTSEYNECTAENKFILSGLSPGNYEFLIMPHDGVSTWTTFPVPETEGSIDVDVPTKSSVPIKLEGYAINGTAILLNWTSIGKKIKYFTVCYINEIDKNCENGSLVKSYAPKVQVNRLTPNTTYEFRVRSHLIDGTVGPFSKSLIIKTPEQVPSPVLELKYKIINESTICLSWEEPRHKYGIIRKYIISYAPETWLLEHWINITVPSHVSYGCWQDHRAWLSDRNAISIVLGNLSAGEQYLLLVRAVSNVGIGYPTFPIVINTKILKSADGAIDAYYHHKVGIIVGTVSAMVCVAVFIVLILLRRRCVKRRALARARLAASNNYYPAVAHYASHVGAVCILEDAVQAQETRHLVDEGPTTHIPPVSPGHCDTKGGEDFPNGHLSRTPKPYMNGHISSNHVHITENPQYYAFECNGDAITKKSKKPTSSFAFEEDTNSNVKSLKFYDFYRLFDNSKKPKNQRSNQQRKNGRRSDKKYKDSEDETIGTNEGEDETLDVTRLTCLDNSMNASIVNNNRRLLSPVLGPNG